MSLDFKSFFHFYRSHIGDYMHRWILETPFGTLRLHHILRSDNDRDPHDHPFRFVSFLLTGGYMEQLYDSNGGTSITKFWPRFSIVRRKAEDLHRLTLIKPIWTFVISGPKCREWGFMTRHGWVHHTEYFAWPKYFAWQDRHVT